MLLWTFGCPKDGPVPTAAPAASGPLVVDDGGDLARASGAGTVVGTLSPEGAGTVLRLGDGALVWVSDGAPPAGWDWMMSTRVRVQGRLETVDGKVWLREPQAPLPAEMMPAL
jgi:hypothetical protein